MPRIKMKNATPTGENLCVRCEHYTEIRGVENQELRRCGVLKTSLPFVVEKCNRFDDKTATSLWDMQQIAWTIAPDKKGKVGFYSPSSFQKAVNDDKVEPLAPLPGIYD